MHTGIALVYLWENAKNVIVCYFLNKIMNFLAIFKKLPKRSFYKMLFVLCLIKTSYDLLWWNLVEQMLLCIAIVRIYFFVLVFHIEIQLWCQNVNLMFSRCGYKNNYNKYHSELARSQVESLLLGCYYSFMFLYVATADGEILFK